MSNFVSIKIRAGLSDLKEQFDVLEEIDQELESSKYQPPAQDLMNTPGRPGLFAVFRPQGIFTLQPS